MEEIGLDNSAGTSDKHVPRVLDLFCRKYLVSANLLQLCFSRPYAFLILMCTGQMSGITLTLHFRGGVGSVV
ncbi:hypothetical protein M0804_013948 [Polistes exclamans]|nr:hypothetical protein M0804_013948 [Polistes exclamans]